MGRAIGCGNSPEKKNDDDNDDDEDDDFYVDDDKSLLCSLYVWSLCSVIHMYYLI